MTRHTMSQIARPDLTPIKTVGLAALGKFQMKRALVKEIAAELGGEGYLHEHESPDRFHQYMLAARSYVKIDDQSTMLERVRIEHCTRGFVHFRYEASSGPTPESECDDDVAAILHGLASLGPKKLDLAYYFRGGMSATSRAFSAKLGPFSIAGLKVLIHKRRKDPDHVILDWSDGQHVDATIRMIRSVKITARWPVQLLEHTHGMLDLLEEAGISDEKRRRKQI